MFVKTHGKHGFQGYLCLVVIMMVTVSSLLNRVQKYVKEQVLQVVAVIFKRGTLDGNEEAWSSLFSDLSRLISDSNTSMVCACGLVILYHDIQRAICSVLQ